MRFGGRPLACVVVLGVALLLTAPMARAQSSLCQISGPTQLCGTSAELCGPDGQDEYEWYNGNVMIGSSRCISVTAAGTYTLRVWDGINGLWFSCSHTLQPGTQCGEPVANCPRPPNFWRKQCRGYTRFSDAQMARIAAAVDAHSTLFSWAQPAASFCATVASCRDFRSRARRHFAAVWASVSAGELGLESSARAPVALALDTPLTLDGGVTTVGAWLASTDSELMRLDARPKNNESRRAYRRIIQIGWNIDHGRLIGPNCWNRDRSSAPATWVDMGDIDDDLPLEVELTEGPLERVAVTPQRGPATPAGR